MKDLAEIGTALEEMGLMQAGEMKALSSIFDGMEVAMDEIEAGQIRWPEQADKVWDCFLALRPTDVLLARYGPLVGAGGELYRHHVRQLVDRCGQGKDMRPATDAELLCAFMGAATASPLIRRAHGLIQAMFNNTFPDFVFHDDPEVDRQIKDPKSYDAWGGQVEELIAQERQRQAQEFRKLS